MNPMEVLKNLSSRIRGRTSLCAAAALLQANAATIPAQTLPANDPAWSRAVNLMPLIDPARDVIK